MFANIKKAIRDRETVTIGGGEFNRDELQRFVDCHADLLAALQSLVAVCENEGFPHLGRILPAARDAIAKATGA